MKTLKTGNIYYFHNSTESKTKDSNNTFQNGKYSLIPGSSNKLQLVMFEYFFYSESGILLSYAFPKAVI